MNKMNILSANTGNEIVTVLVNQGNYAINNWESSPEQARLLLANMLHLECFARDAYEDKIILPETINLSNVAENAVSNIDYVVGKWQDETRKLDDSIDLLGEFTDDQRSRSKNLFMDMYNINLCYSYVYNNKILDIDAYPYPYQLNETYDEKLDVFFYIIKSALLLFNSYDPNLGWDRPEIFAATAVLGQLVEEYRLVGGNIGEDRKNGSNIFDNTEVAVEPKSNVISITDIKQYDEAGRKIRAGAETDINGKSDYNFINTRLILKEEHEDSLPIFITITINAREVSTSISKKRTVRDLSKIFIKNEESAIDCEWKVTKQVLEDFFIDDIEKLISNKETLYAQTSQNQEIKLRLEEK